jgi:hypothetical protein
MSADATTEPFPFDDRMARWATTSEAVASDVEVMVRCRVQSGSIGSTYAIWIGNRPVLAGWTPKKRWAWRAIRRRLAELDIDAEMTEEFGDE